MKWIKYLKRTPLAQIRADWSEYKSMWRQCVALRAYRRAAREKIIAVIDGTEKKSHPASCICQQYYIASSIGGRNNDGTSDNTIFVRHTVCKKFAKTGEHTQCADFDCPCVSHNHTYVDACERYDLMCRARRDFWRAKFGQANENVK